MGCFLGFVCSVDDSVICICVNSLATLGLSKTLPCVNFMHFTMGDKSLALPELSAGNV